MHTIWFTPDMSNQSLNVKQIPQVIFMRRKVWGALERSL